MAEANHRLPQIRTSAQTRITTAAHVVAQLRARQALKDRLRKQGFTRPAISQQLPVSI
jgi:hypothetical protein